jgi:hypothetical protein
MHHHPWFGRPTSLREACAFLPLATPAVAQRRSHVNVIGALHSIIKT